MVRTFAEAENGGYANIADDDLMMTYEFLLHNSRIRSDGYVVENGVVLHSDMQASSLFPCRLFLINFFHCILKFSVEKFWMFCFVFIALKQSLKPLLMKA